MSEITKDQVLSIVKKALTDLRADGVLQSIEQALPVQARVFLIGGFIRDSVLRSFYRFKSSPRDLDFVVFGLPGNRLQENLRNLGRPTVTTLGGAKIKIGGWHADVWTPDLQIEIAGGKPERCTPEQLLKYSTLTIDAVMLDCARVQILERDFLRAINARTIDLGESTKWTSKWAPYHLAHLASVWNLTRFTLSLEALARIAENDSPRVRAIAIRYLEDHKQNQNAVELIDELVSVAQEALAAQTIP